MKLNIMANNYAYSMLLRHVTFSLAGSVLYYAVAAMLPRSAHEVLIGVGHTLGLLTFIFTSAILIPLAVMGSTVKLAGQGQGSSDWDRFISEFLKEITKPRLPLVLWVYSVPSTGYALWALFHRVLQA